MTTKKQLSRAIKGCRKHLRRARQDLITAQVVAENGNREELRAARAADKRCDEIRNCLNAMLIAHGQPIESGW